MRRDMLKLERIEVGRKHVRALMKKMGVQVIYLSAVLTGQPTVCRRRACLSHRLTIDHGVDALEEAILKYDSPNIMNTDQGSKFNRSALIACFKKM